MHKIRALFKNKFAKSVAMIAGGTAVAQAVNALFSPIITRLYTPEEYGILTVYTAILGMIAIAGALKYEWGIPIAENDDKAANVMGLGLVVLILLSGLITLMLMLFGDWFLYLFNGATLTRYKYFIPLGVLLTGVYTVFHQWAFRKKNFKDISRTKLSQSMAQNITKIGLGLMGVGPAGLILGRIFGQSAGITTLARPFFKEQLILLKSINLKEMLWCAKRYKRFPIFSAPSQILNTAGVQLPVLFLSSMYGAEVIGFYGLASSIVALPMTLIGRSVGDVFYAEAASVGRSNPMQLKALSNKLLRRLAVIGLAPLVTLLFLGPVLFGFVFGNNWYEAGVYARIIAFLVYARFIFTPISRVYSVFEKQREALILDSGRVVLMLASFGISQAFQLSPHMAVGLYAVAMCIVYYITYLWAQKILDSAIQWDKGIALNSNKN